MTADELRALQVAMDTDAKAAKKSAAARRDGILAALAEGRTERWVAAALGVTHGRVGQIKRGT